MAIRGNDPNQQPVPNKIKKLVKKRDNYTCQICGISNEQLHKYNPNWNVLLCIDHKVPACSGGSNDPSNLRTLCEYCNNKKSSEDKKYRQMTIWDYLEV